MQIVLAIPVYNGEHYLLDSINRIVEHCRVPPSDGLRIVILDNGSTDNTRSLGEKLCYGNDLVDYVRIESRGRGVALRHAWSLYEADIYAYMDVDLATNLSAWELLISSVSDGHCELAIGSRRTVGAKVQRVLWRNTLSGVYHAIARRVIGISVLDLQCGFKAFGKVLSPVVRRTCEPEWLFDSEFIAMTKWSGFRVLEIPVEWEEATRSTVFPVYDGFRALTGLYRIRKRLLNEWPRGLSL